MTTNSAIYGGSLTLILLLSYIALELEPDKTINIRLIFSKT